MRSTNAGAVKHVHLRRCKLVADGKGRSLEEVQLDMEWCEALVNSLV